MPTDRVALKQLACIHNAGESIWQSTWHLTSARYHNIVSQEVYGGSFSMTGQKDTRLNQIHSDTTGFKSHDHTKFRGHYRKTYYAIGGRLHLMKRSFNAFRNSS